MTEEKRVYMDAVPADKVEELNAPAVRVEMAISTHEMGSAGSVLVGSPNRHVLPHIDGWKVTQPDNDVPLALFEKKTDAVAAARLMCLEARGELFVHGKNGKIQSRNSYGNDSPDRKG